MGIVAGLVAGLALFLGLRQGSPPVATLRLTGHIEATETNLGFKVPGIIKAIHFQEGQEVRAGQVVAELEAQDLRQEVAAAAARLDAAQANLQRLRAGYRPQEVREAQAAVAQAQAEYDDKARDFTRYQNLFSRKVVSAQTRDRAEAAYLMAKESLARAQERYDLLRSGFRAEDIEQGRAEAAQARANLELARTRLGYAVITSPVDGVVLVRPAEPGQVAQVGATILTLGDLDNVWFEGWVPETDLAKVGATILTLGDLDNVWFEGWVPETDLAKVRYGQKAQVTTDSYPGKVYPGWVSYLASKAEFTPKMVETFKERITLVYRTKIRVDNPRHELKPGMPAQAVIEFE